jgi:restriction endonuclease S subunit
MIDSLVNTTSTKVSLKDCCEEIAQRIDNPAASGFERFVGLEHLETGETSIRNWGSTEDVTSSMKLFKTGDVIVARRNVYLRRAARAHFDGVCSGDGIVLRTNPSVCLPDLLPFLLNTDAFWAYVTSQADGTMSKRITVKRLLSHEFALPPLEEQRRIAEVLQATETAKETCANTLSRIRAVAVALGHARSSVHAKDYPHVDLEEVADVRYGLTVNQTRKKSNVQAPYLRVANVDRGSLDLTVVKEIGVLEGDDFELQHGDALIVEGHADPTAIGRAAVWLNAIPGMMHQNHLIRARCGERLDHDYLCMLINSPHGMVHFQSRAKSSSGLNTINSTVVKKYRIPLPPREVQKQVVNALSEIKNAASSAERRLENLKSLGDQLLRSATGDMHDV